jgi:sugar phosphate isomerase/epimerase
MIGRFAASTGCCLDRAIADVLPALHQAGITAVEIGTPPRHFDPWSQSQLAALAERLQHFGIQPVAIHAPFGGPLDLSDPNPYHRHGAIGTILVAASAIREVGGTRVVVHVSDVPRDGQDVGARLHWCTDSLRVLARSCRHMNVTLLVETPLPHLIGGHPDEFSAVLRELDRSVGVCFDTSHTTLGHHWDRFVAVAGDRLQHVHASDHHGRFDDHLPPGAGVIDWRRIRHSLETLRFDGWIVLELACPGDSLASVFSGALAKTRDLFRREA